jgi:DNA-binding NarL/FixJ family response regulator
VDNNLAPGLIISKKDSLRDGLAALLDAMTQLGSVKTSDTLEDAIRDPSLGRSPALVILDARASGEGTWLAVRRLRARWPNARLVILAVSAMQQAQAEAAHADAVLTHGFPAARLVATIVRLLPQAEVDDQVPTTASERRFGAGKRRLRCAGPGARGPRRESKPVSRNSRLALAPQEGNRSR